MIKKRIFVFPVLLLGVNLFPTTQYRSTVDIPFADQAVEVGGGPSLALREA